MFPKNKTCHSKADNCRVNTGIPSGVRSLTLALCLASWAGSGMTAQVPLGKVINTSWIEQSALKWGFVLTTCSEGFFDGVTESGQFGGHVLCSSDGDNYHAWKTGEFRNEQNKTDK